MVIMAEAYGADIRLVAFTQYLKVVMVALVASAVARIWAPGAAQASTHWLGPVAVVPFMETLAVAAVAGLIGDACAFPPEQVARFVLVLVVGPSLARFIATRIAREDGMRASSAAGLDLG